MFYTYVRPRSGVLFICVVLSFSYNDRDHRSNNPLIQQFITDPYLFNAGFLVLVEVEA